MVVKTNTKLSYMLQSIVFRLAVDDAVNDYPCDSYLFCSKYTQRKGITPL
jgi:hypothetical protein